VSSKCEQALKHINETRIKIEINNLGTHEGTATTCLGPFKNCMSEYQIERLSATNLKYLKTLYRASYGKTVSIKYLTGKYDTQLFGAAWIGYLAFSSDRTPAAFYGVLPCRFRIDNEIFLAAQSADTMTHPDHRKKGLFLKLAQKTYELAQQEGIDFIFGFPNQHSHAGFIKLKWYFMPKPMQLFVLQGSKYPWAALLLRIPVVKHLYKILKLKSFKNSWKDISAENGVVRDTFFAAYKAQYSETYIRQWPHAYSWIKNDGSLKIGFLEHDKTVSASELEFLLKQTAHNMGCGTIVSMTTEGSQLYCALIKIKPPQEGLPIGFFNLTERTINFNKATFEYCDIDTF
jgi:hypothetical protein